MNGLVLIPLRGSHDSKEPKAPKRGYMWQKHYEKPAAPDTILKWMDDGYWLGIATGACSGNLEVIDFDHRAEEIWPAFLQKVMDHELEHTIKAVVKTGKGWHVYYRAPNIESNQHLARQNVMGAAVLIETRGEGGFIGTPCKSCGGYYEWYSGDPTTIPSINRHERDTLIEICRSFDETTEQVRVPAQYSSREPDPAKPGDDFTLRTTWPELLEPDGWTLYRDLPDGSQQWSRPGKHGGVSATTNHRGNDLFHCFTSSVPNLQPNRSYTRFAYYTATQHDGDYSAAAKALRESGYGSASGSNPTTTLLTNLIDIATESVTLFCSTEGTPYALLPDGRLSEVDESSFAFYLSQLAREQTGSVPSESLNRDARTYLARMAEHQGERRRVHTRVGFDRERQRIVVDLRQSPSKYVVIDKNGWKVTDDNGGLMFNPKSSLLPMPTPKGGGNITDLRRIFNVSSDTEWYLLASWILAAFKPFGAYPILNIMGGEGTGKSTVTQYLRRIIDPTDPIMLGTPKNQEAVQQHAIHNHVLAYDNLSGISNEISDVLCVVATGGGFSTRTLYTTAGRSAFSFKRPIIVAGIDSVARRGDFISRSLGVTFEKPKERLFDWQIAEIFDEIQPGVLGHIFSIISTQLANYRSVDMSGMQYRLADYAQWTLAAVPSLQCTVGEMRDALDDNYKKFSEAVVETNLIAQFLVEYMDNKESVSYSAHQWYEELAALCSREVKRSKDFPPSPSYMGREFNRLKTTLERLGIYIESRRGSKGVTWTIKRME